MVGGQQGDGRFGEVDTACRLRLALVLAAASVTLGGCFFGESRFSSFIVNHSAQAVIIRYTPADPGDTFGAVTAVVPAGAVGQAPFGGDPTWKGTVELWSADCQHPIGSVSIVEDHRVIVIDASLAIRWSDYDSEFSAPSFDNGVKSFHPASSACPSG